MSDAPKLSLYNSLTRTKEEFKPRDPKHVTMYVCGPTVYDRPHIGNARAVVVYDVLYRLLKHLYPKVTYVRNITDVDDKINAAAKANGETIGALTARITEGFHADMKALGNLEPTIEPKATEHIQQMIGMIEQLIANGIAYVSAGHVLFAVEKAKDYGKLSGKKLDDLIAGARVNVESYKKNAGDFVLWKPADKEDDASSVFDSPWGKGRPGWHIECSAMSTKYLGKDFDIHGGGADLKFPHHENEIAQSTCAHPESHYAKYWVHNGFVTVNGEKMSKSVGNFITVQDLLEKGVKGEVIRLALLMTSYNEPLNWTEKYLEDAEKLLDYFYRCLSGINTEGFDVSILEKNSWKRAEEVIITSILDNLNTPNFIANLRGLARSLVISSDTKVAVQAYAYLMLKYGKLLGICQAKPEEWFMGDGDDTKIQSQIDARTAAKKAKDFAKADQIRDELAKQGIILEDSPSGTTWRKA